MIIFITENCRENEELDLGLTQLCGQDNGQGKVTFSTYWERIAGLNLINCLN